MKKKLIITKDLENLFYGSLSGDNMVDNDIYTILNDNYYYFYNNEDLKSISIDDNKLPISVIMYGTNEDLKNRYIMPNDINKLKQLIGHKLEFDSISSFSTIYNTKDIKESNIVYELYVPQNTRVDISTNTKDIKMLISDFEIYISDVVNDYNDINSNNKILIKSLLLNKNKRYYDNLSKRSNIDIDEYNDYLKEINRLIDTRKKDESIVSYFKIKQNECIHILKNEEEILLQNVFKYDEEFENIILEKAILGFSKRIPLNNIVIKNNEDNSDYIELNGENNVRLVLDNIPSTYTNQIKKIMPNVESNIYDEIQYQKDEISEKQYILKKISLRNGYANVILMAVLIILLCLLVTYFIIR